MTLQNHVKMELQRTLNFMDKMCFDEDFEFNHTTLNALVGSSETEFLLSQKKDRQLLYRKLVFDSITSTLTKTYTQSLSFFTTELRPDLFRWFLGTQPVKSRHYKDIANEFCDFVQSLRQTQPSREHQRKVKSAFETYPFLFELFLYEKSWHQLTFLPDPPSFTPAAENEPLSESKPVLNPALLLLKFEFDVHKFSDKEPVATQSHIVLVRNTATSEKMEFELHALGFAILEFMQRNPAATVGGILNFFIKSTPDTEIEIIQSDVLGFIKTFISKNIILGFE